MDSRVKTLYMYFLDPGTKEYYDKICKCVSFPEFLVACLIASYGIDQMEMHYAQKQKP